MLNNWNIIGFGIIRCIQHYYEETSTRCRLFLASIGVGYFMMGNGNPDLWHYYRLKQTDLDGQDTYSAIQTVSFDQNGGQISVYPNPTRGQVFINGISSNQNKVLIEWYDAGGKRLAQESAPVSGGPAILNPHFNNGIYLLKIITAEGRFTFRQVIIMK